MIGRLVDELDFDPCTIELRHILEQIAPDGTLTATTPVNEFWHGADPKYIGAEFGLTEIHHSVTIPKRGTKLNGPPVPHDGWSFSEHRDAWHFHLRTPLKTSLRREREKIASLYKGVDGAAIASRVEQMVVRWNSPLEPTEQNQYRVSSRRLIGVSVILKYSLQSFENEIENTTKIGTLMKEIWHAMTGKDPSYLFRARKLAGLPSLKPERKKTSTTQRRAGKSHRRPRS